MRAVARERGFALLAVMLVLAIVGVVGAEFSYSMRQEASAARAYKELILASHLAESAVEQAIREIAGDYAAHAQAARAIACDHFEATRVLAPMLEAAGL
jgi:type II secretory pathway pseudopilin PulG